MRRRPQLLLIFIILLGFFLRIFKIIEVPPSLNWDEVSHGYNAYSILLTGKDEWGISWPTIFRAYGDYKLPVYIYATSISEYFFGVNALAVRLPSLLAGVVTILFTYLLTKKLFEGRRRKAEDGLAKTENGRQRIAVLAALLIAIEPWSFFLSRGAFEANLSLPFIIGGVYFFLLGLKKPKFLLGSAVLLGLSVWTYNSARIFVPLLLVLLMFLYKKEVLRGSRRILGLSVVVFALFFIPMLWQLFNPAGQARYGWVAIIDEGAIQQINKARGASGLPAPLPRLLHNKATFFGKRFVANYASHFSPQFLFLKGGSDFQFNLPGHGLIYLINAPFFVLGFLWLLKKRNKVSYLVLGWIFLGPIASSLTREAPHTLRAITMLPMPMVVTAIGLVEGWRWWSKTVSSEKWVVGSALRVIPVAAYFILLAGFAEVYLFRYFIVYPLRYSWSWQYGYTWVVDYAKAHYTEYDRIIVTKKYGEPHESFLFHWPWPPDKYQNDPNLIRFFQSNWYWVDRFDKFYFVNDWDVPKEENGKWKMENGKLIPTEGRTLLITSPGNVPPGWEKLKQILFLDGKPVFEIYEHIS